MKSFRVLFTITLLTVALVQIFPVAASADAYVAQRKVENEQVLLEVAKIQGELKYSTVKVGNLNVNYAVEKGDKLSSKKITAMKNAIKKVDALGFDLPDHMNFIISQSEQVRNVAFLGDQDGGRKITVFLGPKLFQVNDGRLGPKGVADDEGSGKPEAVIIHELGHVLHELLDPAGFWAMKDPKAPQAPPLASADVTAYSRTNKLEYIAEVFTGVVVKNKYPKAVFDEYKQLGGPSNAKFVAAVKKLIAK